MRSFIMIIVLTQQVSFGVKSASHKTQGVPVGAQ